MIKICNTCTVEKSISEFRKDSTTTDGRRGECKGCSRLYHKSRYVELYGDKARARNRERYQLFSERITQIKAQKGCYYCIETEPVCLEFHHLDPSQKDFVLSGGATRSWNKIVAEIDKCIVLCSNCHKKVHAGLLMINLNTTQETA